jgi:hypothetical protein
MDELAMERTTTQTESAKANTFFLLFVMFLKKFLILVILSYPP